MPTGITAKKRKNYGVIRDAWRFRHDSVGKLPKRPDQRGSFAGTRPALDSWGRSQMLPRGYQERERKWRNQTQLPHSQASGHTPRILGCVAEAEVGMTRQKDRSYSGQMES